MKKVVAEYDCFISMEPCKNLLAINASGVNNYADCECISVEQKHKIPELKMTARFPSLHQYRKPGFDDTLTTLKTHIDESASSKNSFSLYKIDNEIHFVPIVRPFLKLYVNNVKEVEYTKKNVKNENKENKNITEEFENSCKDGEFKRLTATEKSRQIYLPVTYSQYGDSIDLLRCNGRDEIRNFESIDPHLSEAIKSKKAVSKNRNAVVVSRKNTTKRSSLEAEMLDIMITYKMLIFKKMMDLLKDRFKGSVDRVNEERVLEHLPSLALLVCGYWVVKSEVLYRIQPGNLPFEVMCPVRDYVMCLFYDGIDTTAKKIQSITKIPSVEATEILEQFATRVTHQYSGKCHWQYRERNFSLILSDQSEIMIEKRIKVCQEFRLQSLLDDVSRKTPRRRSISTNLEGDLNQGSAQKRLCLDSSASSPRAISKRRRQNSTPLQTISMRPSDATNVTVILPVDIEGCEAEETPPGLSTEGIEVSEDTIMMFAEFMKEEPMLVHTGAVKTEANEVSVREEVSVPDYPPCFPSQVVYTDIKSFISKQFNTDIYILPINVLAMSYIQDNLTKLNGEEYSRWKALSASELTKEVEQCLCTVLNEVGARRLEIVWPEVDISLLEQSLYLPINASVEADTKLIDVLLGLLGKTESVTFTEVKKALSQDKVLSKLTPAVLRKRLLKYCDYRKKRYFLRHTVS